MAPTTLKRSRPSFSPPRPGKSKVTKSSKDKSSNSKSNAASKVQKPRVKAGEKDKEGSNAKKSGKGRGKQRGAGGTMRAFLDEDEDEEDEAVAPRKAGRQRQRQRREEEEEDGVQNEFAASMDTEGSEDEQSHNHTRALDSSTKDNDDDENDDDEEALLADTSFSSPEPDFILAEITHPPDPTSKSTSSNYPIPTPLIHRIMHTNFTLDNTGLSSDAKSLIGKYIEIFVKESVRRCVDEKKGRAEGDTGWLEVEDLERVGGQMVLDF